MRNAILFPMLLLLTFACEKESVKKAEPLNTIFDRFGTMDPALKEADGYLFVVSNQMEGHDRPNDFHVTGNLTTEDGNPVNWSVLELAGIELDPERHRDGQIMPGRVSEYFSFLAPEDGYGDIYNGFRSGGMNLKVNTETKLLELPEIIRLDLSANEMTINGNGRYRQLSRNQNLIIRWNQQNRGEKYNAGDVVIYVVYHGTVSQYHISEDLPMDNVTIFKTINEELGEVIITPEEMETAGLPTDGLITITIGKSSYHLLNYDLEDFEIVVGGITYEASDYLQIVD